MKFYFRMTIKKIYFRSHHWLYIPVWNNTMSLCFKFVHCGYFSGWRLFLKLKALWNLGKPKLIGIKIMSHSTLGIKQCSPSGNCPVGLVPLTWGSRRCSQVAPRLPSPVQLLHPQGRDLEELQVGAGDQPKLCPAAYHISVWKAASTG